MFWFTVGFLIGLLLPTKKVKIGYFGRDGGQESNCWGYWLIECKALFSIVALKFTGRSREAFHTHAFDSISWLLKDELVEEYIDGTIVVHRPSIKPIMTYRDTFHKVSSTGNSWVLSFRGPWNDKWSENTKTEGTYQRTHGRKRV